MRPALKSGLLPVWRDWETLQIGIDPRRAVALAPMRQAAFVISLLDGSRDREQVIAAAVRGGLRRPAAEQILTLLAAGGVLDDFPAGTLREVAPRSRARLAAELATASLAHRDSDGGARSLARRRQARVGIRGDRRVATEIARLLAASGVGLASFGGPPDGARDRRRPPGPRVRGPGWPADLVVLVGYQPPELLYQLIRDRVPHLAAAAGEAIGIVGPLALPGRTACLRCLDHFRTDADPAWPLILAQLARRRPDPAACDAALAAEVAAQAARQVLVAIDRTPAASAAVNGTLELVVPGWQWRRRSWRRHPACLCGGQSAR
jgi:hypothetical protein